MKKTQTTVPKAKTKPKPKSKRKTKPTPKTPQDILTDIEKHIEFKKTIIGGERMELDSLKSALFDLVLYIKDEFETLNTKLDTLNK